MYSYYAVYMHVYISVCMLVCVYIYIYIYIYIGNILRYRNWCTGQILCHNNNNDNKNQYTVMQSRVLP